MSIRIRLLLAFSLVAVITSTAALILALVYFERRLASLPPDVDAQVQRRLSIAGGQFDGFAELSAVAGVSLVAGVLVALLLARRITTTLRSVTTAAARVASGRLDARATGRPGRDELGRLVTDFNAMAAALQALDHERAASSAAIAHELRTPLAALTARLQALADGVIAYGPHEPDRLLRHTSVLHHLVEDLRTLSLANVGHLYLNRQLTDLRATVADAVDAYQPLAATGQITLALAELPAAAMLATVDAARITQVLTNLLDNALRHTPPAGTVTVAIHHLDAHVTITVDDAGPGIPAAERARVFDRFTQLDPARQHHGSGLGLTIVHALVTAHHGTVTISDAPTGGTRVTVNLPQAGI